MAIVYTEKGYGLHLAIRAAGHWLSDNGIFWTSSDDVVVQAIIDAYVPLQYTKDQRIELIKAQVADRIAVSFPAIASSDQVDFYAELWSSIKSTAKQTTPKLASAIAIYLAGKDAVVAVNGCVTESQVASVVVAWPV